MARKRKAAELYAEAEKVAAAEDATITVKFHDELKKIVHDITSNKEVSIVSMEPKALAAKEAYIEYYGDNDPPTQMTLCVLTLAKDQTLTFTAAHNDDIRAYVEVRNKRFYVDRASHRLADITPGAVITEDDKKHLTTFTDHRDMVKLHVTAFLEELLAKLVVPIARRYGRQYLYTRGNFTAPNMKNVTVLVWA